jgi:hypothetical protein
MPGPTHSRSRRSPRFERARGRSRIVLAILFAGTLIPSAKPLVADAKPPAWTDDKLVASYRVLLASGDLDAAILNPTLPDDPPQAAFLEALAWYAAGTPAEPGRLTLAELDAFRAAQAGAYRDLLKAKVEEGRDTDYPRTRTWKLVQKLTLLRNEMASPARAGAYAYAALPRAAQQADAWDREHTLGSVQAFADKVCARSAERPVLVKFGNTNCTQCMLFEITGSVEALASLPAHKGVDVYKVWWGLRPDASFAGRIRDPERFDDLVKAEGVKSSPTFVVYRNGRRYPCGSAFPDEKGFEESLDACLRQDFAAGAPPSNACVGSM